MGMTPDEYLWAFVQENYSDFQINPDSVRHGFNAALTAFSLADHVINYYKRQSHPGVAKFATKQAYYASLTDRCPSFQDVQSVANVYKHLYQPQTTSTVSSAGSIETVYAPTFEITVDYSNPESPGTGNVVFKTKTGERKRLLDALDDVLQMWEKELAHWS